jgi:hypothetical protein
MTAVLLAAEIPIQVNQGATYQLDLTWKDENDSPRNLGGYTARMQVRGHYNSASPVLDISSPSEITFPDAANGEIRIALTDTVTAGLPAGKFLYDLEMESGSGEVTRIAEGTFTVLPEVTR